MAIISSGIYPINPNVTDGTQLANYINELVTAINSNQASATRPPLITKGGVWTKLVNETDVDVMVYDGTTDYKVASIVNGEITGIGEGILEAPTDGKQYARQDENWTEVNHPTRLESNRNLIINGDMQIAQRGTSASGKTTGGYFTVDRWETTITTSGTWTMTQDTDVPSGQGFASSIKFACTTANASLSTNSQMRVGQHIEAQNLQHLAFATVNAKKITFSFWVKSNKTGTYNAWTTRQDSGRMSSKQFTISLADTWEKKILTFDGDTTGTIANDNSRGMEFNIVFAAGTDYTSGTSPNGTWQDLSSNNPNRYVGNVNLADSTSNYINITGVQLEIGDTATPYHHIPYDLELQRCKRYYQIIRYIYLGALLGQPSETTISTWRAMLTYSPQMRASPSVTYGSIDDGFSITSLLSTSEHIIYECGGQSSTDFRPAVRTPTTISAEL